MSVLGNHKIKESLVIALLKHGADKVYSTMYPSISPDFFTPQDVVDWFRNQPDWAKIKFTKLGYLTIYSHTIALKDQLNEVGNEYKRGEVLSTDEVSVYDFKIKNWL